MGESAPQSSRILVLGKDGQAMRVIGDFAARNGYSVIEAMDAREAAGIIKSAEGPRIAIIDAEGLGADGDGIGEAMAYIKGDFSPYLILMTAKGSEAEAANLAGPGPKAFLCKPFLPDDLDHRLEVGRHIDQLQRKLRKAKAEVAELTMTDILTKVPNEKAILERLKAEMLRVAREDAELYVGLLDIDRFKALNEAYGAAIGDCVLVECVTRAVSVLRPYDAIGRLGGGRFLIIVPVKEGSDPYPVFERIRRSISRMSVQEGELSIPATVSIGVARWEQWNGIEDLIAKADTALALAKSSGRDRVEISD
jgi:two-component system, cell cycle response regulator